MWAAQKTLYADGGRFSFFSFGALATTTRKNERNDNNNKISLTSLGVGLLGRSLGGRCCQRGRQSYQDQTM